MIGWFQRRKSVRTQVAEAADVPPFAGLPPDLRLHAIGDIHGCDALLARQHVSIDEMQRNRPKARVVEIVLGDMIDRGPESRGVISRLIARSERHSVVVLRGNHEAMMLRFLADPLTLKDWIRVGGLETLKSYGVTPVLPLEPDSMVRTAREAVDAIPAAHIAFLQGLVPAWTCGGFTFVHAGLRPGVPLAEQAERDLTEIREPFLSHAGSFGTFVVHGHTPVRAIDVKANRINIDTGAFATGNLSSIAIESGGIFSLTTSLPSEIPQGGAPPTTGAPHEPSAQDSRYTAQAS